MSAQQIPVVVLAGFLGSGKTTLLNHLLRTARGTRVGVMVNDFGSIEIDAMTVAGQVGSTVSLGNGCLCCAVDASELDTYLEALTRPSARLDVIVIEASGLAEPQELVRMVLASDNERVVYGGLVEVVDAAEFDATRVRHPETDRHLALADLVVVNKADRVPEDELRRVRDAVTGLAGRAAVITAAYGRVDPELLFDRAARVEDAAGARQLSFEDLYADAYERDHRDHPHAAYETVSFTAGEPLHPRRLMDFLDSRPEGLYRIKGFVDFGAADPDNRYAVHAVGRFLRFYPEPWPPGGQRLTQLVLIGSGTDGEALLRALDGCRVAGPHDTPEDHALWGVLRYVPDPREGAGPVTGPGTPAYDTDLYDTDPYGTAAYDEAADRA
ncbi:CobW family GTP-binding protein [Streptomyces roseolilacinus]|uniref:Cobalamin biosynthesis protein CobW n=1 Tax=Streptomyces roseolilacinus TaxID=66904 RepID=A0A918AXL5_9ACTN|nr:GTP-binding protein [Streptomyces roseolilacinus]GGP98814.1 cobalamin biosynthesis protein CobW [Streptomyces roseolilacinus]